MYRIRTRSGTLRTSIIFVVLAVSVLACRNPVQTDLSDDLDAIQLYPDPVPMEFTYNPAQPVLAIDFGNFSQKTIILRNAETRQAFLVKANGSDRVVPGTATGAALSRAQSSDPGSYPGRREHEAAIRFNANPPPIPREPQPRSLVSIIPYGASDPTYIAGTTQKRFWIEQGYTWTLITATLQAIGRYSYVWVADDNYDADSTRNWDNRLTREQAGLIRDRFDGTIKANYRDGIFKNVSTIFGHEYGGGDGGYGGQDRDQHISILIYDIDGDYSTNQSGGVFGYFWSKDHYTQTQLYSYYSVPVPQTNFSEIFYLDAHFTDSYPQAVYSTMAHEYQHMIHFNMKYIRREGLRSDPWFNEMCSMVAEDLVLANIGLDPVRDGPQARLDIFNFHYAESGVIDWLPSNAVLKSYAGAFGFGSYLARNFGGAGFFHEVLHNDMANEAAISAAMAAPGAIGNGMGFDQEFLRYGEALVLTAAPALEGLRSLNRAVTSTFAGETAGDSISYTALPIDLAAVGQYNMDIPRETNQSGPRSYLPLEEIQLRPYGSSIHTQAAWAGISGDLELILDAPADRAVRFYLIVR